MRSRAWVRDLLRWYNTEHRHSRIRFVTPAQVDQGLDVAVLAKRHEVYKRAYAESQERWAQHTRNWQPIGDVALNPERLEVAQKEAA